LIKESKLLLAQRSEQMSHPLMWEFPGGKLHKGESPEKCIKREIMEELHVRIEVEQLLPSVIHNYGSKTVKLIPFICSLVSDEIRLVQHRAYTWVSKNEVTDYDILPPDLEVIKNINREWE
ncbi:(deoxy)nucleoside triphosphate pyrophosphohydrolase, partial [Bacteroidota bacterium]